MFYAPLVLAEESALSMADSSCWSAYPKRGFSFPRFMKISAVPGSKSGVFNHIELFVKLLSIEGRPERWEISECNCKHKSVKELRISGVSNVVGRPGQVAAEGPAAQQASAPSLPPPEEFDIDFFDVPGSLSQMSFPAQLEAFRSDHGFADAGDRENQDADAIFNFEEEEFHDSDIESEDDQQRRLLRAPAPVDLEEDRKSESGRSAASAGSGRVKSTATDLELLRNCLGEARPFAFLFSFLSSFSFCLSFFLFFFLSFFLSFFVSLSLSLSFSPSLAVCSLLFRDATKR